MSTPREKAEDALEEARLSQYNPEWAVAHALRAIGWALLANLPEPEPDAVSCTHGDLGIHPRGSDCPTS